MSTLWLVATPIGNLADLSPRAVDVLAHAGMICCEDTRRTGMLLQHAGVKAERLAVCNDHTEFSRVADVLGVLTEGRDVAIVSDAGTPGISDPGERIVFYGRDAFDLTLDPDKFSTAKTMPREGVGIVHALTGPVFISGAKAGDVLAVTIEALDPADVGWTEAGPFGFAGDQFGTEQRFIIWRIKGDYAVSDALPGVRIPNASFPGVVTTLPGEKLLADVLARETQLLESGGVVMNPDPDEAEPAALCGPEGTKAQECLRTIPPREHGGNMDIRYITTGTTVYLPCFVDGCGLAVGDFLSVLDLDVLTDGENENVSQDRLRNMLFALPLAKTARHQNVDPVVRQNEPAGRRLFTNRR